MKFEAQWPIEDDTVPLADLIAEAWADLPHLVPVDCELHHDHGGWQINAHRLIYRCEAEMLPTSNRFPLPFAPLEPLLAGIEIEDRGLRDVIAKARTRGACSVVAADRIAIAMGLHPGLIWPEQWWLTDVEEVA